LTCVGVSYILSKFVEQINKNNKIIKIKVHPHTFCHSKSVYLLEAGTELIYIRYLLGHSTVKTTEIYPKMCTQNKREALEKTYQEVTKEELADWRDDSNLINWNCNSSFN
jgi:Site-specific recombinase XerD